MKGWKLEKFGSDVVHDLRSRGLLPFAALLVVCIVAAPILIKSMSSSDPAQPASVPTASASKLAPEGQSAVLSYNPGLRDYRRRLGELGEKNPFTQKFVEKAVEEVSGTGGEAAVELGGGGGSSGVALEETVTVEGGGGSGGTGGSGGGGETETVYFYYQTDVLAGEAGGKQQRRNRIDPFTLLPSEAAPVLVYLGIANGGKQAIFSVSRDVTGVSGSGTCFPDPDTCQLLGLARGASADLANGADNKVYSVEVARIKLVTSSKPPG